MKMEDFISLGLASFPSSEKTAIEWASGKGILENVSGSLHINIGQLSRTEQVAIVKAYLKQLQKPILPSENNLVMLPKVRAIKTLSTKHRTIAENRLVVVSLVEEVADTFKVSLNVAAKKTFEAIQNKHQFVEDVVPVPDYIFDAIHNGHGKLNESRQLSFSTLYRWALAAKKSDFDKRILALAPMAAKVSTDLGTPPEWMADFLSYYRKPSKPTIKDCWRYLCEDYQVLGKDAPQYHQVVVALRKLPAYIKYQGRETGSEYRARLPYIRRDWQALRPNDVWIGDGHSFKAKVQHPEHGQPTILEFTLIMDGCSGAIMGWSVALSESTVAVLDALRHAMIQNGVPLIYYSDNGAGQTAKAFDHEVVGIFKRLGIEHATGIPGNPQGRGRIERIWQHTAIRLAKTYETYGGKDADPETVKKLNSQLESVFKAEAKGKKLTPAQLNTKRKLPTFRRFLADLEEMVDEYNFCHCHSSLPIDPRTEQHFTPFAYYQYRIQTESVEIVPISKQEADVLLRPQVVRTVSKRGEVRFLNNIYFNQALLDFAESKVSIAYDIHDARSVIVNSLHGEFICHAVCDANKRAAFPLSFVEKQREDRKNRKIAKAEKDIALAKAEISGFIEHQADFSHIPPVVDVPVREVADFSGVLSSQDPGSLKDLDQEDLKTAELPSEDETPIFNFEWEREAWKLLKDKGV